MELPKFLLGDNTDFADDIFIIHLDYPRFIINLKDDEVEFMEEAEDRSTRTNVKPLFTGAGLKVIFTSFPVCNPTPVSEISVLMVFCLTIVSIFLV